MSITKISPSVVDFDDGITISTTDNSDNLTLTSTDTDANTGPVLNLNRAVTGADDDLLGSITFAGQDDANNAVDYAFIQAHLKDASDGAEDGLIDFQVMHAGTSRSALILNGGGTVIVNQDSQDMDFRVESNDNANALIVNGGNNNVGIGADPLISYSGYTTLYVGGNTNFMSNTAAEASSSVNYSHNAQFDTDGSWEYIVTDEASNYYQSGGGHYFRVAASGSAGSDITWVNGPNIDVNGNLVFPSGKGIDFSATGDGSGTDSSELLDDYEEGSWTPVIKAVSGTSSISFTNNQAGYTKIGRLVLVQGYFSNIDMTDLTSGTYVVMTGLPYTPAAYADFHIGYHRGGDNFTGGYLQSGTDMVFFVDSSGVEIEQGGNHTMTSFMFNVTYITS